jgi:hypothetical protein
MPTRRRLDELIPGDYQGALSEWRAPVMSNPNYVDALMRYTRAEVGGQGPEAQMAFMEAMTNMAGNRGKFLPKNFFPDVTHSRATRPLTEAERVALQPIADAVARGSNVANYATGNASGTVGFGPGGYRTASYGGENYGVESADRGWWTKLGLEGPKAPGSVGYTSPGYSAPGGSSDLGVLLRNIQSGVPSPSFSGLPTLTAPQAPQMPDVPYRAPPAPRPLAAPDWSLLLGR